MPKAETNVVKFPTARIARRIHHLENAGASEQRIALDTEYESISKAIDALNRQRQSVLTRLHALIRREGAQRFAVDDAPAGDAA